MPRHIYPGKKIYENHNYFETIINFDTILHHPKIDKIIKPNYQGSLNENIVDELVNEYKKNKLFLRYKNKIVIGELNNNWYILDGQHRLKMVEKLGPIDEELCFCWYKFYDENHMRELFNSINKDSTKNQWFINCEEFKQIKIIEFSKLLAKYYKKFFSKTKTTTGKIYTIEEFIEKLNNINFFDDNNKTAIDYYIIIKDKNQIFYDKCNYNGQFITNKKFFYKDEYKNIEEHIIFTLKNNNFIEWLYKENQIPIHKFLKGNKDNIPKGLKKKIWEKYYKDSVEAKCPISWCTNILNNEKNNGWDAGHIISEANGGINTIDNLKPICKNCNCEMYTKNWKDFDITYT